MTTSNKNSRFCFNNWVSNGTFSVSSSAAGYSADNLVSGIRSKVWQTGGLFEIDATNNKVYINATTYTVAVGSYTVATLITAFNAATSQTLSRNGAGKFVITLGGAGTFNFGTSTNAIWTALGFLSVADVAGTVATADERRYSTSEWIKVDLGFPQIANFAALIPPSNTAASFPTATISLQGNNTDTWAAPAVDLPMEVSSNGAFVAPDVTTSPCRYWRIKIVDVKNSALTAAVAYMGDSVINTNTNVATEFSRVRQDTSQRLSSEGGQLYIQRGPRVMTLSNMNVYFLKAQELTDMEQLVYDLGTGRPFFICIDPEQGVSSSLSQMTHYVEVEGDVTFSHVLASYYNLSFALREVL